VTVFYTEKNIYNFCPFFAFFFSIVRPSIIHSNNLNSYSGLLAAGRLQGMLARRSKTKHHDNNLQPGKMDESEKQLVKGNSWQESNRGETEDIHKECANRP
jgi:hypothetical protein